MVGSTDDDGAWASDDIPVPDPPALDDVTRPPRRAVPLSAPDAPSFEPLAHDDGPPSTPPARRLRLVAAAAIAGVTVAAVAVVMSIGGDADRSGSDTTASTAETSTPEASPPSTDRATAPTVKVTLAPVETPVLVENQIELPPSVAAIGAPTELLLLTDDGVLHTLSLPSGRLRSVALREAGEGAEGLEGAEIVVSPEAAALTIWPDAMIVPRDGQTFTLVDGSQLSSDNFGIVGWSRRDDGQAEFWAVSYLPGSEPRAFTIDVNGTVADADPASIPEIGADAFVTPDGDVFVNDAGGVYQVAPDGSAERIGDGRLNGVSATHLLVRTCTAARQCGLGVVERSTGRRHDVPTGIVPDQLVGDRLDLSPDGSAVSWVLDRPDGSMGRSVADLTTGQHWSVPAVWWTNTGHWAADSSGVFEMTYDTTGVDYLDRTSGEISHFADELGRIVAMGIRLPESELGPQTNTLTTPITFGGTEPSASGLTVTALMRSGNVVEVDLDARAATVWSTPPSAAGVHWLFRLGADVAVVPRRPAAGSSRSAYIATPGARRPVPDGLLGAGPVLPGPRPDTVWTADEQTPEADVVLVDLARGERSEPPASVSLAGGTLLGGDGRGGLVVQRGGDVFLATTTSQERLTSGELLAIGADTAFVRECDEASNCAVVRVDRRSGERRAVPPQEGLDQVVGIDVSDPPIELMGAAVAPGGDVAVVRVPASVVDGGAPTDEFVWALVDVTSGSSSAIDGMLANAPVVWSEDGSVMATLVGPDLVVVERASGRTATVNGLGSLAALAGRAVATSEE